MSKLAESEGSFEDLTVQSLAPSALGSESGPTVVLPALLVGSIRPEQSGLPDRLPIVIASEEEYRPSLEADELLRGRLRAACVALGVSYAIGLVGRVVFVWPAMIWIFPAVMVVFLTGLTRYLALPRALPARALRQVELAVFGLSIAYIAIQQDCSLRYWARRGGSLWVLNTIDIALVGSVVQMLFYGMLIPNDWRRASLVVPATVLVPLATLSLRLAIDADVFQAVRPVVTVEWFGACCLSALAAMGLTVYGVRVINELRAEVTRTRALARYLLGDRLGSGGMGDVYKAEHVLMKRPCAIKLIRPGIVDDPVAVTRFEREVRATSTLTHPNTIEIYDFGWTTDGRLYYVMEYLQGLDLETLVRRFGPLPPGRVIHFLRQACGVLAEAHAAGIIHRDLKPANLFAAQLGGLTDFLKVLDFGLAKMTEPAPGVDPSAPGMVRGTPSFMAPEQVLGGLTLDGRADLYALGCVAFFLLTGRPPFIDGSRVDLMISQVRDPVVAPSSLRPDLPADLEQVILTCLAKSAADRFPDALRLSQALAACDSAGTWDSECSDFWWMSHEIHAPIRPKIPG